MHQAKDVASDQLASGIHRLIGSDKLEKYLHTHNKSIHASTQQDLVDSTDRVRYIVVAVQVAAMVVGGGGMIHSLVVIKR